MKNHIYIPVFATTLLVSAALLFSIQPLFSKMILPLLGGTPHVWNTAMLFFQVMLLAGYAYAHGTSKILGIRAQALLQLGLLALFTLVLPIAIPEGWLPPVDRDPTLWQLSVMAVAVGGPFFVLAGTAPMLQHWFSRSDHKDSDNPYFLYAASNLGSMASLLAYPFIIEPLANLSEQSGGWAVGYMVLIALTLAAAVLVWTHGTKDKGGKKKAAAEKITWERRGLWLILSFTPSSLMLGVTTFITTDIASVPLLWILPLALYVSTFIIVFARKEIIRREYIMLIQAGLLILALIQLMTPGNIHPALLILLHLSLFFFSALACHTELSRSKPHAEHLTEFYLIMSLGGALGGFFNAIIVPNIFIIPLEYPLALALAAFLRYSTDTDKSLKAGWKTFKKRLKDKGLDILFTEESALLLILVFATLISTMIPLAALIYSCIIVTSAMLLLMMNRRIMFAFSVIVVLLLYPPNHPWGRFLFTDVVHHDRNFFGVIRVADTNTGERMLLHGTTNHGAQPLKDEYKLMPLSYYSKLSPVNDAFKFMDRRSGRQRVGVIGLGIGVTACFSKQGRSFDFYEIDPDIASVAENEELFTYLSDCGSPYKIILGDGRLKIAEVKDRTYDMILLDAFSSDNIPVHLLTLEAIELYMSKLKKDGIMVFNISNNYIDIEPVLAQAGKELGMSAYARYTQGDIIEGTDMRGYSSHFFIISATKNNIPFFTGRGWTEARFRPGVKLWTDQFSNIVSVLENKVGLGRHKEAKAARAEKEKKEGKKDAEKSE